MFEDYENEKPKKSKKEKKPMDPERKKKLIEQLKAGRKKALENRQKGALVKKIKKEKEITEVEETIHNSIMKKKNESVETTKLQEEINILKQKLEHFSYTPKQTETEKPPIQKEEYTYKKIPFNDKSLISKIDTENEKSFSTFKSSLWD